MAAGHSYQKPCWHVLLSKPCQPQHQSTSLLCRATCQSLHAPPRQSPCCLPYPTHAALTPSPSSYPTLPITCRPCATAHVICCQPYPALPAPALRPASHAALAQRRGGVWAAGGGAALASSLGMPLAADPTLPARAGPSPGLSRRSAPRLEVLEAAQPAAPARSPSSHAELAQQRADNSVAAGCRQHRATQPWHAHLLPILPPQPRRPSSHPDDYAAARANLRRDPGSRWL